MNQKFIISALSKSSRPNINEDSTIVQLHPKNENCCICTIADGQGGRSGGKEASHYSCFAATESVSRKSIWKLRRVKTWEKVFRNIDSHIKEKENLGVTTFVGLIINKNIICGASNGDSKALYISKNGSYIDLTKDQEKVPPFGSGVAKVSTFSVNVHLPGMLLLLTDGVTTYVNNAKIISLVLENKFENINNVLFQHLMNVNNNKIWDDTTIVSVSCEE